MQLRTNRGRPRSGGDDEEDREGRPTSKHRHVPMGDHDRALLCPRHGRQEQPHATPAQPGGEAVARPLS